MNLNKWFPIYMKALYILSQTYLKTYDSPDPDGKRPTKEEIKYAFKCFIQSLINIVPDEMTKEKLQGYVYMNQYVEETLMSNEKISSFLKVNTIIKNLMTESKRSFYNDSSFLDLCLNSEYTMLCWVYLMHAYIIILLNKYGNYLTIPNFNDMYDMFKIEKITKDDWGNSLWFIIHMSALHGAGDMEDLFYNYKSMLSCLQYLLPCPKCRAHLRNNLAKIEIDYCKNSRENLFECSWRLHNIVNKDLGKPQPTLQEAKGYFAF